LVVIPHEKRHYTRYLDREFLKAYEIVDCRSSSDVKMLSLAAVLIMALISKLL